MSSSKLEFAHFEEKREPEQDDFKDCLICKLMTIKHEKANIVKYVFSSDEPMPEKIKAASLLTGLEFDKDMVECLENPSINQFIFSD